MKRVCLVVDHPLRDLDGLVLLGMQLSREGADAFLVPMYQLNEVFLLRPDLVLVNYVRPVNAYFIKACNNSGIRVGVLDTEGGVLKDVEQFARSVCAASEGLDIDLYCAWGEKQYSALSSCRNLRNSVMVETGCPRYDFTAAPWNRALPHIPVDLERFILVNTNFPVISPRFQSGSKEMKELANSGRYTESQIADLVKQSTYARGEMVRAIQDIAGRMPDAAFILRPHPFENRDFYVQTFSGHANVHVIQSGGVLPWIERAVAVVHHNCATAIESFMMGREPIHMAWIDTPMIEQPASVSVSLHAASTEHLESLLRELWQGLPVTIPSATLDKRKQIIRDWFHANDGNAAMRVTHAVMRFLEGVPATSSEWRSHLWRVFRSLDGVKRKLQFLLLMLSNRRIYELGRKLGGRGRVPDAKRLDLDQVKSITKRLATAARGFDAIGAEMCSPAHAGVDMPWTYSAIRLSTTAPALNDRAAIPGAHAQVS